LLNKYGNDEQKIELSSIHKFRQKVFFFWTSLNTINTNMTPYYSIIIKENTVKVFNKYPIAHTCSAELEFPVYESHIEMFQYLLATILQTDFGLY
jgi:hypothetical protein